MSDIAGKLLALKCQVLVSSTSEDSWGGVREKKNAEKWAAIGDVAEKCGQRA